MSVILYGFAYAMASEQEMARFGLFSFKNETKNKSQTCAVIHSASFATFIPRFVLQKLVKQNNNIMNNNNMNKTANFSFVKTHLLFPFHLILSRRGLILLAKNHLTVVFSHRMLPNVVFWCAFY